jgi:hypothetical protein
MFALIPPKYIPIWTGIIFPLSVFLNLQSITVPGWTFEELPDTAGKYHRSLSVFVLSILAFMFGIMGIVALFVRMLEQKIKWMTRLIMTGSWMQASLNILTIIIFLFIHQRRDTIKFTEAVMIR